MFICQRVYYAENIPNSPTNADLLRPIYIATLRYLHNVGEGPGDEAKSDQLRSLSIIQQIMGGKNAFAGLGKTVVCAGIEIDSPLVIQALIGAQYRQVLQHVERNGR